jgi:peptide/nickel transport system ATP-binding protein
LSDEASPPLATRLDLPASQAAGETLLEVEHLAISIRGAQVVSDVSLKVGAGEVVGLVGESGSGKTLTGLGVLGLLPNAAKPTGRVNFLGVDMLNASKKELRALRGAEVSMIFQEPLSSLNPSFTVGRQIVHVIRAHEELSVREASVRAVQRLGEVGLPNPGEIFHSFPHELSGGMAQRAMIAMALACEPKLLIADEPTTALDATIQAQIMELLQRVVEERQLAVLLISHNMALISEMCGRVVTMYCGQVVSMDSTRGLLNAPSHPYAWALQQAARVEFGAEDGWGGIKGVPANPFAPPSGCRFHPRCPFAEERCAREEPALVELSSGALTRCLLHDEIKLPVLEDWDA